METAKKIRIGWKMMQIRILGRRIPITIGWDITNRCNLRCQYCRQPTVSQEELDEATALRAAREMVQSGVEVVTFSGGEPLMRPDFGAVVEVLDNGGVHLSLNTNGVLIDVKKEIIRRMNHVKVSLDGGPEIHDRIRGEGIFQRALHGLEVALSMGIGASIGTVLSDANVRAVDEVFHFALEYKIPILFQPIAHTYTHGHSIAELIPNSEDYQQALSRIIEFKKKKNLVVNSLPALEYLKTYPNSPLIPCYGGRGIGRICADGTLVPCVTMRHRFQGGNLRECSFEEAFKTIPPSGCKTCYCSSTLDFNLLLKPDIRTFRSFARRID